MIAFARAPFAAAALAVFAAGGAAADTTAIDGLTQRCIADGTTEVRCNCFRDFILERFSAREIEGAWIVFSDDELVSNPPKAIDTLVKRGFTSAEIFGTAQKVISLQTQSERACPKDMVAEPEPAAADAGGVDGGGL